MWTENDSSGKYKHVDIIMFSFINFPFLFNRRKDGLTDGLLNNLVRYVIHCKFLFSVVPSLTP